MGETQNDEHKEFSRIISQLVNIDLPNTFKNFWIANKTIG